MGLFGEILGTVALGALGIATGNCDVKFDVYFENDEKKDKFFKLLNKWDEIFQRRNLIIDPTESDIPIYTQLNISPLKINNCTYNQDSWIDEKKIAKEYKTDKLILIISSNSENLRYKGYTINNIVPHSLAYNQYIISWKPNKESELGFLFKCFNHNPNNDNLESILYLYFKNKETIISSAVLLHIVKRGSDTNNYIFKESELGLERLLTILNRHDIYEHLQEFLKQPYSLSENRQKELAEQKRIETKKAALLEKMKHEKEEIIKKQEKIEQQQREEAERQAKLEAEKKQNDAINALNDL